MSKRKTYNDNKQESTVGDKDEENPNQCKGIKNNGGKKKIFLYSQSNQIIF